MHASLDTKHAVSVMGITQFRPLFASAVLEPTTLQLRACTRTLAQLFGQRAAWQAVALRHGPQGVTTTVPGAGARQPARVGENVHPEQPFEVEYYYSGQR